MLIFIFFTIFFCFMPLSSSFNLGSFVRKGISLWKEELPVTGVEKLDPHPVLKVIEPDSQCTVHLVGVSHGAQSSAELVKETMRRVKPSTVILELCDERYLSICLDSRIKPNVNANITAVYNAKLAKINARKADATNVGGISRYAAIASNFNFLKSQGFFVGTFISLGLFVSSLQKFLRPVSTGDEFTTAMREAEGMNIPVRLGDARQSATLESLRKVVSFDTIDPKKVLNGAKSLAFSGFGVNIDEFPDTWVRDRNRFQESMALSEWISIPSVYANNRAMMKSLIPLVVITAFTTLLGNFPSVGQAADISGAVSSASAVVDAVQSQLSTIDSPSQLLDPAVAAPAADVLKSSFASAGHSFVDFLTNDLSPEVESKVNLAADAVSALLLIRLAKLIGSDRDRIIASKIQATCKEFSVRLLHMSFDLKRDIFGAMYYLTVKLQRLIILFPLFLCVDPFS